MKCSDDNVLRRLLCIRMPYSANEMFVTHGIPSFYELRRKCSLSTIFRTYLSPKIFIFSQIRPWWRSVF